MFLMKNENPVTNILGMTKKEVIFTLFINRKELGTPNDAINLYHRLIEHGIIEETEIPERTIKNIPKEVLDNMERNITTTKKEDNQPCYIERYKNFTDNLVGDIDKILGDKKEEASSSSLTPLTDEDFKKIVSKNTNIKL